MEEGFKEFILNKARNMKAKEMCEDDVFISRLLADIPEGRSKRFNKNHDKSNNAVTGFDLLRNEYEASKTGGE